MDAVDPARSSSRAELEADHPTARPMPSIPPTEEEACSRSLSLSLSEPHHMPLNMMSTSLVSLPEIQAIQELDNELMDVESIIRLGSQHVEEVNEEYEGSGESETDISPDSIEPHVGMEFANLDIAYDFYNHYALQNGFGIRKSKSWKSRSNKDKILAKFFVCNKEGIKASKEGEDFRTINSKPNLDGQWKLEETAASRYTKKIFENYFRQELKDSRWCWNRKVEDDGTIKKYIVGHPKSQSERTVTFENSHGGLVTCDCRLFEQMGILCKHALNVLWQEHVLDLPERYILKRWTIESRHKNIQVNPIFSSGGTATIDVSPQMYFELRHLCNFVVEESSTSLALYKRAYSHISDLVVEINQEKDGSQIQEHGVLTSQVGSSASIPFFSNVDKYSNIIIHDPSEPARTKGGRGRPKGTIRWQSRLEMSQNEEEKQSRRCKGCGLPHHNIRTCPAERAKAEATIKVAREATDKD